MTHPACIRPHSACQTSLPLTHFRLTAPRFLLSVCERGFPKLRWNPDSERSRLQHRGHPSSWCTELRCALRPGILAAKRVKQRSGARADPRTGTTPIHFILAGGMRLEPCTCLLPSTFRIFSCCCRRRNCITAGSGSRWVRHALRLCVDSWRCVAAAPGTETQRTMAPGDSPIASLVAKGQNVTSDSRYVRPQHDAQSGSRVMASRDACNDVRDAARDTSSVRLRRHVTHVTWTWTWTRRVTPPACV